MPNVIAISQTMVKSDVWVNLGSTAKSVYLIFRCKCQYSKMQGKKKRWVHTNNGEIVFTYKEALEKYGITRPRFTRAIDELLAKGFIDIKSSCAGIYKATTLYGIADRWQEYGIGGYKMVKRPKPAIQNPGFKKIASNENVTGIGNENVTGQVIAAHRNVTGQKTTKYYKYSNGRYLEFKIA